MEEAEAQRPNIGGDLSEHLETIDTLKFALEHPQGDLQKLKSRVSAGTFGEAKAVDLEAGGVQDGVPGVAAWKRLQPSTSWLEVDLVPQRP